jgi:hypothetical protein
LPTLRYNIEMPTNTYIGFGYSWGMHGVDMVAFMAGTDNARVKDLWALEENTPAFDAQQDYTLVSQTPITNIQG